MLYLEIGARIVVVPKYRLVADVANKIDGPGTVHLQMK